MSNIRIDWSINATTLLSFAAGVIGIYTAIKSDVSDLRTADVEIRAKIEAAREDGRTRYEATAVRLERNERVVDMLRPDHDLLIRIDQRLQRLEALAVAPTRMFP